MGQNREYRYCGPERQLPGANRHQSPLSGPNALAVIREAWTNGNFHLGSHLKKRLAERGIDMIDVGSIIQNGNVRGSGEYCPDYKNCKYCVSAIVDERNLEVVIALDPAEDYTDMPLAVVITAYERPTKPGP